jgi:hypothetical protein
MALGSNLAADIQAVFDSSPASAAEAAEGIAQAYYDYAQPALFGASIPVITTGMRDVMKATLETGVASPGAAATIAASFSSAVLAFWSSPPPAVAGGSGSGAVVGCPGAAAITATLTTVFLNLANTSASAASGIASALITATLTVTALLTLPPAGPVPVPIS